MSEQETPEQEAPEQETPEQETPEQEASEQEASEAQEPAVSAPAGELQKADLGKRFVAAILDSIIAMILFVIPFIGWIFGCAYLLLRDGLQIDFMDQRSLGKKLMKLRPVALDGTPLDAVVSIKRNWMFAIGGLAPLLVITIIGIILIPPLLVAAFLLGVVEIILVVTDEEGRRLGDKIANTMVIEVDD